MKKIILTVLAISAFTFSNAQNKKVGSGDGTSFGVKAGLNMSSITNLQGASTQVGVNFGGFAKIMVTSKFAVQPELLFSTQGAKFDGGSDNLNYINIPIMAKYYVANKFNLEAGPQIGFLMSAKEKIDGYGSSDFKDQLKTTDFGLNFGAGYDITNNLSVGARYCMGLSQLQKDLAPGESASKNSVFQIDLGYKF